MAYQEQGPGIFGQGRFQEADGNHVPVIGRFIHDNKGGVPHNTTGNNQLSYLSGTG